jgi:hypothetical protein
MVDVAVEGALLPDCRSRLRRIETQDVQTADADHS